MRKQTKLVAVASAAALMAIGASMTSFAATGWVEENGEWFFYDKDENRVEDEWKKSGDNWYWLDSENGGAMATDKLVEDDDNTYYVDANGVMVRNTWVKVVNEDQDDEDPAEYIYYYMQSTGKAYKTSTDSTQFKTIDGKRYAFDEDGKMLYGWVNETHERLADEDWSQGTYFLGSWDDGALKTGWQKIYVEDDDTDGEYWFSFKSNGTKRYHKDSDDGEILEAKINGRRYGFDERGVMTYQWTVATAEDLASTSTWKYFSDPEDGARMTKGWFKVTAPEEDNDNTFKDYGEGKSFAISHANDETESWYYADGDGNLAEGEIKKIKGKYYGFRPDDGKKGGAMLNGLCLLKVNDDAKIVGVAEADMDSDYLNEIIDGDHDDLLDDGYTLYYFGNDADSDGAMKTGTVSLSLDGDSFNMLFTKTGGAEGKGRGVNGIDNGKYIYKAGVKLKAGSDDKYMVVEAKNDIADAYETVSKISTKDLRNAYESVKNNDGETVKRTTESMTGYYLVNTSGSIVKNKTAAKDGDEWYFYVDDAAIKMYTNNKTLPTAWKEWK